MMLFKYDHKKGYFMMSLVQIDLVSCELGCNASSATMCAVTMETTWNNKQLRIMNNTT